MLYYRQTTYKFYDKLFLFLCAGLSGAYPTTTISQPLFVISLTFSIVVFEMLVVLRGFFCSLSPFLSISLAILFCCVYFLCNFIYPPLTLQYLVSALTLFSLFCFVSFGFSL